MKILKFFLFLIVYSVIAWYLSEGLLWLEFLMKPYTEIGKLVASIGQHLIISILFIVLAFKHSKILE